MLAKGSYAWFEKRRKTKALELAQQQIIKALDTVALLHQSIENLANGLKKEANQRIQYLFQTEEEVDKLRREVFKEMSKHTALSADYREDILHLVKRLDTLADHVKDAARCLQILQDTQIPEELIQTTVYMTLTLVECTSALRTSIEKISSAPEKAIQHSAKVEEIEDEIDKHYVNIKRLLVTHGSKMNSGAVIIFDGLIEFIERAADICADTADYIILHYNPLQQRIKITKIPFNAITFRLVIVNGTISLNKAKLLAIMHSVEGYARFRHKNMGGIWGCFQV